MSTKIYNYCTDIATTRKLPEMAALATKRLRNIGSMKTHSEIRLSPKGNEVHMTSANSLRSRVKGNFHARFWRPTGLVRDSLSLIKPLNTALSLSWVQTPGYFPSPDYL